MAHNTLDCDHISVLLWVSARIVRSGVHEPWPKTGIDAPALRMSPHRPTPPPCAPILGAPILARPSRLRKRVVTAATTVCQPGVAPGAPARRGDRVTNTAQGVTPEREP